jgi:phosphoribosylformylglycinamidine cyclo-ligase
VHALAHITGGGIPGNLNRVLPEGCHAVVNESSWQWPALFTWMMDTANIERSEMYRTFNCGVGMILVVNETDVEQSIKLLTEAGETPFVIGDIKDGKSEQQVHIV